MKQFLTPTAALVIACCIVGYIAGCAGRGARPITQDPESGVESGPWFCQMSVQGDGWACRRLSPAAPLPIPERRPKTETAPAAVPADEPAPDPEPAPAPTNAAPSPAAFATATGATTGPAPVQPASREVSGDLPDYQRLAYQPAAPVALVDLPANFYALQLLAMKRRSTLEAFAEAMGVPGLSAAPVERDGTLYYVLLLGIYENRTNAEAAIEDLPAPFADLSPWIRSLGSLQAAMARAAALTRLPAATTR